MHDLSLLERFVAFGVLPAAAGFLALGLIQGAARWWLAIRKRSAAGRVAPGWRPVSSSVAPSPAGKAEPQRRGGVLASELARDVFQAQAEQRAQRRAFLALAAGLPVAAALRSLGPRPRWRFYDATYGRGPMNGATSVATSVEGFVDDRGRFTLSRVNILHP